MVALDVHPLQIDLYFDFLHSTDGAVVSLAPTALLDLASWNVCPVDAPHGATQRSECYSGLLVLPICLSGRSDFLVASTRFRRKVAQPHTLLC